VPPPVGGPTSNVRTRYARTWIEINTPQTTKLAACNVSTSPPRCVVAINATPLPNSVPVETTSAGAINRSNSLGGPFSRYGLIPVY
jgi:hypothetical protein